MGRLQKNDRSKINKQITGNQKQQEWVDYNNGHTKINKQVANKNNKNR